MALTLNPLQIAQYAYAAGFRGQGLITVIQIALQESGGLTNARNVNTDGSVDRGLLQWNNHYWSNVSTSCADDPLCALQTAYQVTNGGKDFSPWNLDFTTGRLNKFTATATDAANGATGLFKNMSWQDMVNALNKIQQTVSVEPNPNVNPSPNPQPGGTGGSTSSDTPCSKPFMSSYNAQGPLGTSFSVPYPDFGALFGCIVYDLERAGWILLGLIIAIMGLYLLVQKERVSAA